MGTLSAWCAGLLNCLVARPMAAVVPDGSLRASAFRSQVLYLEFTGAGDDVARRGGGHSRVEGGDLRGRCRNGVSGLGKDESLWLGARGRPRRL